MRIMKIMAASEVSAFWKAYCQLVSLLSSKALKINWAIYVKSASRKIIRKM